jgi:hypothetical protein
MMNFKVQWAENGQKDVCTLSELDAVLDDLQDKHCGEPVLVAIEGPENRGSLTIGLGLDRSVLNHVPASGDPPYLSSIGNADAEGIVVFYYMGHWTEIRQLHLIPIDLAREAARYFFVTGRLLEQVKWQPD